MTKEELREILKNYFADCDNFKKTYTIPGIAEAMKWSVDDVLNYPSTGELSKMLDHAKLKCENSLISDALRGKIDKTTAQLILKTHFGYKDKKEVDVKGKINISSILDEIEQS